jgi:hypothetical protein
MPSTCAPALRIAGMTCAIFSASANRTHLFRIPLPILNTSRREIGRQIGEHVITNYLQPVGCCRATSRVFKKWADFLRSGAIVDAPSMLQVVDLREMRLPLRLMLFDY